VRLDPEQRTRLLAVAVAADDVNAAIQGLAEGVDAVAAEGARRADGIPGGLVAPVSGARDAFGAALAGWPGVLALADNLRPRDGPAGLRLLAIAEARAAARPDPE